MTTLENDGNLARATEVEGYKVLPPCVIYGKIGQGGMGAVYRGRHLNLDIDVAVKCLKPELVGGDDQFVVRFRREARAAAQINHQNVIRVFDVAEDQGLHYLIMELVQGETARERVARKGKLAVGEALEIVYGAALGLAEAHRKGFVHRDIKPDNIMISSSGQVKVADLGLAKPQVRDDHASMLSGTNVVMGTPQYMPPEQWESTAAVTAAADVWALGATLYYLLVGGEAIQKDSLPKIMQRILLQPFPDAREKRSDVPADVAAVIAKATATAIADRYADAQELADAIQDLGTRRESLRDKGAAPTGSVSNQVLSPPPATTLAKIKFWLDKQGQETASPPAVGPQGTMVLDGGAGRTITELTLKRRSPVPWIAGAAALLLLAILLVAIGPWRRGGSGIFAEADRLEGLGQYAAAIQETNAVHAADPSLPSALRGERLARLHAAWARELGAAGQWNQALLQLEQSLAQRDGEAARRQKTDLLARIRGVLDGRLVRTAPATAPVPRGAAVEFQGRFDDLDDPIVRALRIGGRPVDRSAGAFTLSVDTGGRDQVEVEVTLSNGEGLALSPWPIVYAAPAVEPTAVDVEITPATVELGHAAEAELVVRTSPGAEVRIDGGVVAAEPDGTTHRYRVRSDAEAPAPLAVVVTAPGRREVRRSVPVQRRATPLAWLRQPALDGARALRGEWVTKETSLRLSGQVDGGPATLRIGGQDVAAEWTPQGAFTATVPLPGPGEHVLRIAVVQRFRTAVEQDLRVRVLGAPAFEFTAPTKNGDVAQASSYPITLHTDAWTTSVSARRDGVLLRTAAPAADGMVRLDVPLQVGANTIDVTAVNVVGLEAVQRLELQRVAGTAPVVGGQEPPVVPAGGKPSILQIVVVDGGEERAVVKGRSVFVRSGTLLQVRSTDPDAIVLNRDKELTTEDFVLQAGSKLLAEPLRCEVKVKNGAGVSEVFKFGVQIDDTPPEFTVTAPVAAVGAGVPFVVAGTWKDEFGVRSITVNGIEAEGATDGGRGTFRLQLEGITAAVELPLVITDRAGNRVLGTIRIEP
ncbi:MAG: serine/threonine protein kinase [Planctomycetes bacterium]|nr:serine/threonine protein kinase [Planctomycetota bacterium]